MSTEVFMLEPGSWALLPSTYPSLQGPHFSHPARWVLCGAMLGTQKQAPSMMGQRGRGRDMDG